MFGLKKLNARLAEAEARITGLVKLREIDEQERQAQHETNKRLAGAIDELERRIADNHTLVNAAFGGLSRRVGTQAIEINEGLASVSEALAEIKQIAAVPSAAMPSPALPQQQCAGDGSPSHDQQAIDDHADGRSDAPTSQAEMDRLVLGGAFDLPDDARLAETRA